MIVIYVNCGVKNYMKVDHRSYTHNFCSGERKAGKKNQACTGFEPLTSAIPVQRSTSWANKPTGSRSLNWFVINPWKDDDESHICELQGEELYENRSSQLPLLIYRYCLNLGRKEWKIQRSCVTFRCTSLQKILSNNCFFELTFSTCVIKISSTTSFNH